MTAGRPAGGGAPGDLGPPGGGGASGDLGPPGGGGASGDLGPPGGGGASGDLGPPGGGGASGDLGPPGGGGAPRDLAAPGLVAAPGLAAAIEAGVRTRGLLRGPVIVLLSGGRDSTCLLDLAVRLAGPVAALHLNYGLRDAARDDEAHCRALCDRLCVELVVHRPPRPEGGNVQAWARDQRYAEAARLALDRGALVASGHTATDQVETVLYRLAASPGRRALLGMPERSGRLIRPLLHLTREQTAAYCAERGLAWREDASNAASKRGTIRDRLLPLLRELHPAAEQNILRTLELLRDEAAVLDAALAQTPTTIAELAALPRPVARLAIQRLADEAARGEAPLPGGEIAAGGGEATAGGGEATAGGGEATAGGGEATAGGGEATAGGGEATGGGGEATGGGGEATGGGGEATAGGGEATAGGGEATAGGGEATAGGGEIAAGGGEATARGGALAPAVGDWLDAILALGAHGTAHVDLPGGLRATSTYGRLAIAPQRAAPPPAPARLDIPGEVDFAGGTLTARAGDFAIADGTLDAQTLAAPLHVRGWRPGDRMRPLGLDGTKSLQDLFTDRKIPRQRRHALPIVLSGGEIAWIPGVATGDAFKVTEATTRRVQLRWDRPHLDSAPE